MRPRSLRLGYLVAAIALVTTACAWPQLHGDAARSGLQKFESKIGVGNVSRLAEAWAGLGAAGSPVVANGHVFAGGTTGLHVYDVGGCSGVPAKCTPIWSAAIPGVGDPAIDNGVVYATADDGNLYAFDAAGVQGCSGVPKVCAPLWVSMGTTGRLAGSSPAIAEGRVFVASWSGDVFGSRTGQLLAFDATGQSQCAGVPRRCSPLWSGSRGTGAYPQPTLDGSAAVADGVVYVGSMEGNLLAFDAAGSSGCSGTPKHCNALWTGSGGGTASAPSVVGGLVFTGFGDLQAFDAKGTLGCSGSPKTCTPLWRGVTGGDQIGWSMPAVANGVVLAESIGHKLYAFDALGVTNCSAVLRSCAPLWTADTGSANWNGVTRPSSPTVANGVVYIGGADGRLYAFGATGQVSCSGVPKICNALFSTDGGGALHDTAPSAAVADGIVYIAGTDGNLHALSTDDPMNPSNCDETSTASAPTVLDAKANPPVSATGTVASMVIKFDSPCGIRPAWPSPQAVDRPFAGETLFFIGICPSGSNRFQFTELPEVSGWSDQVHGGCGSSSGAIRGFSEDLTEGTWTHGTLTLRYRVDTCVSGTKVQPLIELDDNANRAIFLTAETVAARFPAATSTCA